MSAPPQTHYHVFISMQKPPHYADSCANICSQYHIRTERLEDEKYDLEYIVKGKDYQVHIHINTIHTKKNKQKKYSNDENLTPLKMLFLINFTI